jgi:septal ring factor EnvC (AmiA/AmiB activator)
MLRGFMYLPLAPCLQTERDGLSKQLAAASKQLAESNSKVACASLESQTVNKEQRRLQAEVERLSSVVHSHSVRLQKCVQNIPEDGSAH